MKVLMDTSTLVAGMLPAHPHYASAEPWLMKANAGAFELFISVHSIAEMYAVLTRLPLKPAVGPLQANKLISDNVLSCAKAVTLTESDYVSLVADLSQRGIIGGIVYDAVIARAAELSQVDRLVTLNVAHFQRVWPAGAARVISALTPPP
jgi:predicted nucleic acid-binding protein